MEYIMISFVAICVYNYVLPILEACGNVITFMLFAKKTKMEIELNKLQNDRNINAMGFNMEE